MKRSTVISRLNDIADGLDRAVGWPGVTVVAGYVFGGLLEPDAQLERIELALVVGVARDSAMDGAPERLEALAESLRLPQLPVSWWWRPADRPVWNHTISRAVRFWSADGGRDQQALDGLAAGKLENVAVEAAAEPWRARRASLGGTRRRPRAPHDSDRVLLRPRLASRPPRVGGIYPENHLWSATAVYLELDDTLQRLDH